MIMDEQNLEEINRLLPKPEVAIPFIAPQEVD